MNVLHGTKKVKRIISAALLLLCFQIAPHITAQTQMVSGRVTDSYNEPVIGASVAVKGTTIGTLTDINGKFAIHAEPNSVLTFSFVGYQSRQITVTSQTVINIVLEEDSKQLEEVVVTALGISRERKSLGFSTSSVNADELRKTGITMNPVSALYGKAAGVGIQASASGPTGGINIKIRGAARLDMNQKTRPLFVVDGMPIYDTESSMAIRGWDPLNSFDYGSGINDINPEDIESMDILKGAKASVLYGSEGANGVVLITTKKGARTRGLGVSVTYGHTWHQPVSYIDWQNDYGSGTHQYFLDANKDVIKGSNYNWGTKFDGREVTYWDGSKRPYRAYKTNWDDIWQTGHSDDLNVSLNGGNEKGSMRISYTNNNYRGIISNHFQRKNNFSFSGRMKVSPLTVIEANANLYKIKTQNRYPNTHQLMSVGNNRDYDYQTLADNYVTPDGYFNSELINDSDKDLPQYQKRLAAILWHQNYNKNIDDKTHLIASLKANFQFHPLFSVNTFAGIDFTQIDYTRKESVYRRDPDMTLTGGKYRFQTDQAERYNLRASLNYDQGFIDDRLRVTAFAGTEYQSLKGYDIYASTYGNFNFDNWYSINNFSSWPSFEERRKITGHGRLAESKYSAFGDATISFDDKYYLNINLRNDWASTLERGNNSYFYSGVSFNYNFEKDLNWEPLTFGKVRANWANVGAPAARYFAVNNNTLDKISGTKATTVTPPKVVFSGVLKPERKTEYELGTELRFLREDRIQVDFSIYTHDIYNQIMTVGLTSMTGYKGIRINAGNVRTWGYELMLKGAILSNRQKGYRWEVGWTTSNLYSTVKKLYPGVTESAVNAGNNGWSIVSREGERSGQIIASDYKYDDRGNRVVDSSTGLYVIDSDNKKVIGNAHPDFFGGITTDFYYKNFSLNLGIDYSVGGHLIARSTHYLLASGSVKQTLGNRDEASGGIAYWRSPDGKTIEAWEHNKPAPSGSDGRVYHDGIILPGVVWDEAQNKYVPNTKVIPVRNSWAPLWQDNQGDLPPDHIYKNNYLKLRNVAVSYTLPKKISERMGLQKVTFTATANNLCYLYKSVKNVDAESTLGTDNVVEYSNFPIQRSWGLKVNVSF